MKCLVFDIYGDYGHFRKFYTTSSPLTFSIPPRTSIIGMIAALIGLDKDEYLEYFPKESTKIAVKINNPVNKGRISYTLIDTKKCRSNKGVTYLNEINGRTQVTFEILKNPSYRIYFCHEDQNIYSKVKSYLEQGKNYYTLSMGLSEFIADYTYIGEIDLEPISNKDFVDIDTVINFDENIEIEFENGKEYFKDTIQNQMDTDRVVTEYIKVLFERQGLPIKCKIDYYRGNEGEKIVFL